MSSNRLRKLEAAIGEWGAPVTEDAYEVSWQRTLERTEMTAVAGLHGEPIPPYSASPGLVAEDHRTIDNWERRNGKRWPDPRSFDDVWDQALKDADTMRGEA